MAGREEELSSYEKEKVVAMAIAYNRRKCKVHDMKEPPLERGG